MDRLQLVRTEKAQLVGLDVGGPLAFVLPAGLRLIVGALSEDDVVVADLLRNQALRVRRDLSVAADGIRCGERGDDVRIAAVQIPKVVQVAVGEDHEAAVLGAGVLAGLFFADERVLVRGLGFEDEQREALCVEEQEVDETLFGVLEVLPEGIEIGRLDRDAGFNADVGGSAAIRKEAPACCFEQLVDLDAGCGFFHACCTSLLFCGRSSVMKPLLHLVPDTTPAG